MDIAAENIEAFETPESFANWLAAHHAHKKELWLKIYKKQSGLPSVTWEEAVIEAIAYGWIDGLKKSNDEQSWYQRFTPRKPKANWSQKNRAHAEKLIAEGRMQAAGLAHVEAAKADGRWDTAYAGSAELTIPEDFLAAVKADATAQATFDGLKRAQLFAIYYRLHDVKTPDGRARRFAKMLAALKRGEPPV